MAKSVQIRRGTQEQHINQAGTLGFRGEVGEITVDTTLNTIRVHDGPDGTLGGHALATAAAIGFDYNKGSFTSLTFKNSYTTLPLASVDNQGMVAYSAGKEWFSTGTEWVAFTQPSDLAGFVTGATTMGQVGDFGLFLDKPSTSLRFRALRGGNNVTITQDDAANSLVISSANYTGANVGTGAELFKDVTGTTLNFRTLAAGAGTSIATAGNTVTVTALIQNAFNTVSADGTAITSSANDTLQIASGPGISVTGNAGTKTVSISAALTAVNNTLQTGSNILQSYASGAFSFNKLQAGAGVTLTSGANGEVVVSAPQVGTVTNGANATPPSETSLGIFKANNAGVLTFYNFAVGDGLTVAYDEAGNNIVFTNSMAGGGGAGIGTIQTGDANKLAYYVGTGTVVGDAPTASYDPVTGRIVSDITGTVTSISNHTTDALTEGSANLYYTTGRFDTAFAAKSTTGLAEGSNLYFTAERAQDAVSTMMLTGNSTGVVTEVTTTAVSASTATVTVGNVSGISAGLIVTSATIPQGRVVTVQSVNVGNNTFVVTPAIFTTTSAALTLTNTATGGTLLINATAATVSSATLTVTSTTGISVNDIASGEGINGRAVVTAIDNSTTVTVTPGYSVTVGSGIPLVFANPITTGIRGEYVDASDSFVYSLDNDYVGAQARSSISVNAGSGLVYDSVSGILSLSGAVTQVNGQSGTVILQVTDIPGAAPSASPTFTGTPKTPNISVGDDNFKIVNKKYVDDNVIAITGTPGAGLQTIQSLGNAINNDTQFYVTMNGLLDLKLPRSGGTITGVLLLNNVVDVETSDDKTAATKLYVDQRATVQTVNNKSGTVVLNADDIYERVDPAPVNIYFTNARARSAITAQLDTGISSLLSYSNVDGVIRFNPSQVRDSVEVQQDNTITSLMTYASGDGVIRFNPSTTVITEGDNLYYTTARARSAISVGTSGVQATLVAYDSSTGSITINASSDKVSEGTNNLYFQNTRARNAITLSPSNSPFLTYNSSSGQFTLDASTTNITEGSKLFYTDSRVRLAITTSIVNSNSITPSDVLQLNASTGVIQFNNNSNSINEGSVNLFYLPSRARQAISLTSSDATVLTYDNATGVFTYVKPTTDKITEGTTNKYATTTTVRPMISSAITVTTGGSTASHLTYDSGTGVFTVNANIDSLAEGVTNKYYKASYTRGDISLTTATTLGTFLTYDSATGVFALKNNTDNINEGVTNFWASASRVRSYMNIPNGYGGVLQYGNTTGTFTPNISVNTTNLVYTPSADGSATKTFDTVQNISTTSSPKFNTVRLVAGNAPGVPVVPSNGVATLNLNNGGFFEINRSYNITDIVFQNPPASGTYGEVTIALNNASGGTWAFSTATSPKVIHWAGGSAPNVVGSTATGTREVFRLFTYDGGANWYEISRSLAVY